MICMDEVSKQLVRYDRESIPMAPGEPAKQDDHYERCGVEAIFIFFDPIRGWRRVSCRESRTRLDWAEEVRRLLEEDYPRAVFFWMERSTKMGLALARDERCLSHFSGLIPTIRSNENRSKARKVKLVCDNLNTHSTASLYEAFRAEQAHRLARQDWRSTTRHATEVG